jgi:hypothetical protein
MINTKSIRNDVVDKLKGKTVAGQRVYNSKVTPNMVKNLPAILVYTPSLSFESRDHREYGGLLTIELQIEILVSSATAWADTVDDIIYDIKQELYGDKEFLDKFTNIAGYTEQHTLSDDGEQPIGIGTITFNLELFEAMNAE